jgi:hypothetical protein
VGSRWDVPARTLPFSCHEAHRVYSLTTKPPHLRLSHKPPLSGGLSSGEAWTMRRASSRQEVIGGSELPFLRP